MNYFRLKELAEVTTSKAKEPVAEPSPDAIEPNTYL